MELGNVYEVLYSKTLRTIELMNRISYESYDTILLKNVFRIKYNDAMFSVGLYIQRMPTGGTYVKSNLTFTRLKEYAAKFCYSSKDIDGIEVLQMLFLTLSKSKTEPPNEIDFEYPVQFNAQNSGNRSGYGNEYRGDVLVYQGTLYGETTRFSFVGATLKRW